MIPGFHWTEFSSCARYDVWLTTRRSDSRTLEMISDGRYESASSRLRPRRSMVLGCLPLVEAGASRRALMHSALASFPSDVNSRLLVLKRHFPGTAVRLWRLSLSSTRAMCPKRLDTGRSLWGKYMCHLCKLYRTTLCIQFTSLAI